jgi:hypothetical protein
LFIELNFGNTTSKKLRKRELHIEQVKIIFRHFYKVADCLISIPIPWLSDQNDPSCPVHLEWLIGFENFGSPSQKLPFSVLDF